MNVLIVIYSLEGGGAERAAALLAGMWARTGNRVSIATFVARDAGAAYDVDPNVECIALNVASKKRGAFHFVSNSVKAICAIRRFVRRARPDIVVSFIDATNIIVALSCVGLRVPTIACERVHPPMHQLAAGKELARRLTYGLLNRVVAQTEDSARWLRKHTLARHVVTIPNVCVTPIPSRAPFVNPALVVRPERKVILSAGRLVEQKGHAYLLDAFHLASMQAPDWDLVILGEGPLYGALRAKIRTLDLEGRVFLPGRAGNIADWYERAEIFVLSSLYEGFPNVLIEAMAYGLPPISFDCPTGPSVLIQNLENGRLVPTGNWRELSKSLLELMSDEPLRLQLADSAKSVRERYSESVVMAQWNALLRELVPRSAAA